MNKLIFAFILLLSISCCFANAEQVKLEMLCKNSRFTYDGVEVNAILRLHWYEKVWAESLFKEQKYSALCSREDFINLEGRADIRKLNDEWEQIIRGGIFSPTYFNRSFTDIPGFDTDKPSEKYLDGYPETELVADLKKKIKQIDGMVATLEAIGEKEKQYDPCLPDPQLKQVKNFLLNNAIPYIEGHFERGDYDPLYKGKNQDYIYLKKKIQDVRINTLNYTMAFRNESIPNIFAKSIVRKTKFSINSQLGYDKVYQLYGSFYFDVVLPFHQKQIDESKPCVAYTKLPPFYINQVIKH